MNKELFIKTVSEKMFAGKIELFVGSGISSGSGLPSWKDLLLPLANDIGIQLKDTDDLPMIAQYIVNENSGNRNVINYRIEECIGQKKYSLNSNHKAISNMNVNRVWTTNYDMLLEDCFEKRKPNVIRNIDDLKKPRLNSNMEIIKVHGSLDDSLKDIVLTQQDYDEILFKKTAITQMLEDSLIKNSFLFIGYGYRDPDIRNLMIAATMKCDAEYSQDHFIIINAIKQKDGEDKHEFDQREIQFKLWIKELKRIGITALLIESYDELTDVLKEISVKSRGKSVFVSGSHNEYGKELDDFFRDYGQKLAELNDIVMINGQNQGVGVNVVNGFMETAVNKRKELKDVVKIYHNPYAASEKFSNSQEMLYPLKVARDELFSGTQLFVVFAGGMGTEAELEVAKDKNCIILPAIAKAEDFDNELIKKMLKDDYCCNCLKKVPDYNNLLKNRECPSIDNLIYATEKLLYE